MLSDLRRNVYVFQKPVDMRKSYNGLHALVADQNPLAGDFFLFIAKNRQSAKVLFWDGTGFNIWMKRLEQGCFTDLWSRNRVTQSELKMFLEGAKMQKIPQSPQDLTHKFISPKARKSLADP